MKIVVIDNEPIVRSTLQDFLQDAGHEVLAVSSPDELSPVTRDSAFAAEVVLTETQQPASSAQARIASIVRHFPKATIYEMDNAPGLHGVETNRSTSSGVLGHLRKPIRLAELDQLLKNVEMFDSPHSKGALRHRRTVSNRSVRADEPTGEQP